MTYAEQEIRNSIRLAHTLNRSAVTYRKWGQHERAKEGFRHAQWWIRHARQLAERRNAS